VKPGETQRNRPRIVINYEWLLNCSALAENGS